MSESLSNGIGIIIDNDIETDPDVKQIISKIEEKGIPICKFDSISKAKASLNNLRTINFLILDWRMHTSAIDSQETGLIPGTTPELEEADARSAIEFIKELKSFCFAPVFIFTNESTDYIRDIIIPKLTENGLYFSDDSQNFIYVKNKDEILRGDIIGDATTWISKSPSIYLLKIWENAFLKAKAQTFWNLYDKSKGNWPRILWKSFEKEDEDPKSSINEVIFQIIMAEVNLDLLEKEKILASDTSYNLKEIKSLVSSTMYYNSNLNSNKPGDIYKRDGKYYINIRAECDTMPERSGSENIYLIEGHVFDNSKLKDSYKKNTGINERIWECFIFLLEGADIVQFDLRLLTVVKAEDWKTYKLSRLLPPYITHIQQKCSVYLSRIGKPRLPEEIEEDLVSSSSSRPPASGTQQTP